MRQTERRLWRKHRASPTHETRNDLVTWYLPFVQHIARKAAERLPSGNLTDEDELAQVGAIAVMRCIDKFEPERQSEFTTFCGQRIRGAILDHLRSLDWANRRDRKLIREVENAANRIASDGPLSAESVSSETGVPAHRCQEMLAGYSGWLRRKHSSEEMTYFST